MKKIKRRDGFVYILGQGETCPQSEICLLESEYEIAKKVSASFSSDPEQLKSFWESLFEKKQEIPGYTLFTDFPQAESHDVDKNRPLSAKECAEKYGPIIKEILRGRKVEESL